MICNKCGAQVEPGCMFCTMCGSDSLTPTAQPQFQQQYPQQQMGMPPQQQFPQQQQYPQQQAAVPQQITVTPQYPQQDAYTMAPQMGMQQGLQPQHSMQPGMQPPMMPPQKQGGRSKKPFIIAAIISIFVIAGGVLTFLLLQKSNSPEAIMGKSFNNLTSEFNTRVQGSPLEAVDLFVENLQGGSTTVNFVYRDYWSDTSGAVTLHSDLARGDYAINADITESGQRVQFDVYFNSERIAARIPQLDSNFYGINFLTFREDIRRFGDTMGLDNETIEMLADLIDMISEALSMSTNSTGAYAQYSKILDDFIDSINTKTENVTITSGGTSVNVKKIEWVITERMIITLLNNYIRAIENDESMRAMFDGVDDMQSALDPWSGGSSSFDDMLNELRTAVREFERSLSGSIIINQYVTSGDRMVLLEIDADLTFEGERAQFKVNLDFGTSATDTWVFEFTVIDDWQDMTFIVEWESTDSAHSSGKSVLRLISEYGEYRETVEFVLEWRSGGQFSLSLSDGRYSQVLLSGMYTKSGDGFSLVIDNPFTDSYWDEYLYLEISSSSRTGPIPDVDYINFADIDLSFLEGLDGFLGGFGSGGYDPWGDWDEPWDDPWGVPPPDAPPEFNTPTGEYAAALIGTWKYSSGNYTYFFWGTSLVEFYADGTVHNYDDNETGAWYVDGNTLFVHCYIDYYFTLDVSGNQFSITDSDGDTGFFVRTG